MCAMLNIGSSTIHVSLLTHTHIYIYIHVCVYVYVYNIYIYKHIPGVLECLFCKYAGCPKNEPTIGIYLLFLGFTIGSPVFTSHLPHGAWGSKRTVSSASIADRPREFITRIRNLPPVSGIYPPFARFYL